MEVLCRYRYKGSLLAGVVGDITLLNVDAIVNPANSYMLMGGGLAGVLKRKGGEIIEKEALKHAPVPIGGAVVTSAGKLKAKYIIHAPTMINPGGPTDASCVYKATYAALKKALEHRVSSIAIPGMGTGVGGLEPETAVSSMIRALTDVLDQGFSINIYIADLNKEIINCFCRLFKDVRGVEVYED